jgi:hypothetical protein
MRDVDHRAEPVHLADDILAEGGGAVVGRFVGRRMGSRIYLLAKPLILLI